MSAASAPSAPERTIGTKTLLPFRARVSVERGRQMVLVEYDGYMHMPGGTRQTIPMTLVAGEVGQLGAEGLSELNPLGERIYELMQQFWAIEQQLGPALAERDRLAVELRETQAELFSTKKRCEELQRRRKQEA